MKPHHRHRAHHRKLTQINAIVGMDGYLQLMSSDAALPDAPMPLTIVPIDGLLLLRAFPLGQALGVRTLAEWRLFVEGFTSPPCAERRTGMVVATDQQGYVCGLAGFRVDMHSCDGPTLVCEPFLVADLPRYAPPLRALLSEIDRIALRLDCKTVRIVMSANGEPLSSNALSDDAALLRSGFALEAVRFRRRARPEPDPNSPPS